jgi:phosphate transport system substrate-binding protein
MNKSLTFLLLTIFIFITSCQNQNNVTSENQNSEANSYIDNKGSDTMVNLALAWAEQYQTFHPDIQISVTGGGSGTGIASLVNGTVDIANASRAIKEEEIETAKENGIEPVEFIVAQDAIAIIVNPENPINQLTLEQISDIFSGKYSNWAELGGEDRPIVRLSRETNSGTHIYFLEEVLRLGDSENKTLFSRDTLLLPSSEGITVEVRDNPNAIGYDGLGYVTPDVKVIAVANIGETEYILPTIETVLDGTYPISRDLYMYTTGQPKENIQKYLDWILSEDGQQIVIELGFIPLIK